MYSVAGICAQEHMPLIWNVGISVFLITLYIALISYEA